MGQNKMPDISRAAIARIVKRMDPDIRIGIQSKDELRKSLEDYAVRIAELAISSARNANRNTILPQDISAAREQLMIGVMFHKTQISG